MNNYNYCYPSSFRTWFLFFSLLSFAFSATSEEIKNSPKFSITYNALETTTFFIAGRAVKDPLIYLPFHFDGNFYYSDSLSINTNIIYRYESYNDRGPLYAESGKVRAKQIWTHFNELFLLTGPRFSLQNTGLLGFYVSLRAGLGAGFSPQYFNLSALISPELGYTFSFKNATHFNLTLAAGFLFNLPFYETIDFAVLWSKNYMHINALQLLVHTAIPVLTVGIGFNG